MRISSIGFDSVLDEIPLNKSTFLFKIRGFSDLFLRFP